MWSTSFLTPTTISSATNSTPLDLSAHLVQAGVGVLGGTIMRTHIRVDFSSANSDTAPAFFWGIVVYDKTVAVAGTPDASSDQDIDWMIQMRTTPGNARNSATPSSNILYGEDFDLRARRRLREVNDRPFLMFHNAGSASALCAAWVKMLIRLP